MVRLPIPSARFLRWPGWRRPAARLGLTSVAALAVLGAVGTVGGYVVPALAAQGDTPRRDTADAGKPVPSPSDGGVPGGGPMTVPSPTPSTSRSPGPASTSGPGTLTAWAGGLSRLGISTVALQAYGYAQVVTQQTTPACNLSWTTLAGIGKIESNHGTHGGSSLSDKGEAEPAIYGPALDGTHDNKVIRDTDQGRLDQDTTYDRAVGPMQFLPGTWARWGTDADGDGTADPQNINDAALSAARYLCADGHDLATGAGWWQAIHSYNNLDKYASDVYAAADAYGYASKGS
ncbi:lytic transglycosylase domain-containing protein [Actinocatenispora rupis]|uniref:Transglycosylase SLT domain-containing protein n=1 Tax=Actinocatenispora rupis TaxID=519421 RepID=A0A8J3J2W8_9ACTN|nr:lytic murein transglycosylase [Actinocatenispora rupis]GID13605.1 hypothetical protein Aru02nite_44940 [Actinocatenispora rupis]